MNIVFLSGYLARNPEQGEIERGKVVMDKTSRIRQIKQNVDAVERIIDLPN